MGSDRVFLSYNGGEDISAMVNEAIDFFRMLFTKLHNGRQKMYGMNVERGFVSTVLRHMLGTNYFSSFVCPDVEDLFDLMNVRWIAEVGL